MYVLTTGLWELLIIPILFSVVEAWTLVKFHITIHSNQSVSSRMRPQCGQELYQGGNSGGLIPIIAEIKTV